MIPKDGTGSRRDDSVEMESTKTGRIGEKQQHLA
jgi:hypothetical protein